LQKEEEEEGNINEAQKHETCNKTYLFEYSHCHTAAAIEAIRADSIHRARVALLQHTHLPLPTPPAGFPEKGPTARERDENEESREKRRSSESERQRLVDVKGNMLRSNAELAVFLFPS
jgi:hypothetical protein